jgi:hypothetical protein
VTAPVAIVDSRPTPFFWITPAETKLIRETIGTGDNDPGLSPVLAVYTALVEVANETRTRTQMGGDSAGFSAERKKIVAYSGASESTVKRVIAFLERIGLVAVEVRKVAGDRNLPNRYTLITPGFTVTP